MLIMLSTRGIKYPSSVDEEDIEVSRTGRGFLLELLYGKRSNYLFKTS